MMEAESNDVIPPKHRVRATLRLGPETYVVCKNEGTLSDQLVSMKEESMGILKEFITKHNVPNDVPDELVESSSEDDTENPEKTHVKSKKTKYFGEGDSYVKRIFWCLRSLRLF